MCENCLSRAEIEAIVEDAVADLQDELQQERERRKDLEAENEALRERIAELEATSDERQDRLDTQADRLDELADRTTTHADRLDDVEMILDAVSTRVDSNVDRVAELQSRELEKGAHLLTENVWSIREALSLTEGQIERFTGDDGISYVRVPGEADPLERSGTSNLAVGDLLPIQQLARMDDDMLASSTSSLPAQLAAKAWREREDGRLWNQGSGKVREYLDASDLKAWIRREERGISETYAKKLVSRTLDALQELTKDRIYIERRNRRKDGLQYQERRVILPSDSEIPGETAPAAG